MGNFLSDLIFGLRSVLADNGAAPLRSTVKFIGATCSDNPVTDCTEVTITGTGAAPATRVLTAGAGLVGGGDLSADRSFAVRIRPGTTAGVGIYGDGLGAVVRLVDGTQIVPGVGSIGVKCSTIGGLAVSPWGGGTDPEKGLGVLLAGSSGLVCDVNGLSVDATKWAGLVGGKTTAAVARGKTLLFADRLVSNTAVSVNSNATAVSLGVLALGPCLVGDRIKGIASFLRSAGVSSTHVLEVTNTATPGTGIQTASWPIVSQAAAGNVPPAHVSFSVVTAGTYWLHLRALSGGTTYSATEKQIDGEVYSA